MKNAWGLLLNTDIGLIEQAITGLGTIDLTGLSTLTLTAVNGAADQARPFALAFANTPLAGTTVIIPPVIRFGIIKNTGPGVITLQTASATAATMQVQNNGSWAWYSCDGTNVNAIMVANGMTALVTFTPASQGNWVAPNGVSVIRLRAWGGGGCGGLGNGGGGGGGAAGGYAEGYYNVVAGQSYVAAVGSGALRAAQTGGTTSFGIAGLPPMVSATGGSDGTNGGTQVGSIGLGGAFPGVGTAGQLIVAGGRGGSGMYISSFIVRGGPGGAAPFGGAGAAENVQYPPNNNVYGFPGGYPGGGGSGGIAPTVGGALGGPGADGLVMLEY